MQNQEAFVYCWTDHKTNMLYVGYHKGQQDDGYVCSSKWMLEEYNKRPEDFTRQIIAEGTQGDCHNLEVTILKSVDAMHSDRFYNQTNGDKKMVWTERTREAASKTRTQKIKNGEIIPGMLGRKHKEETLKKMRKPHGPLPQEIRNHWSELRKGNSNRKGKKANPDTIKKLSKAHTGKKYPIELLEKRNFAIKMALNKPATKEKLSLASKESWKKRRGAKNV